jgi:AraC-like DNA-binding protein
VRRPIYQDEGQTYLADTCRPVIEAVMAGHLCQESLVHGHYPGRPLPRGALPGVKMVGFWDAVYDQQWGLDWHHNEGVELTFLESGQLGFGVDGESFPLRANDLTITRPWQAHRVGNPHVAASRLHFLILDVNVRRPHQSWHWPGWLVLAESDREELTNCLRQNEKPVWAATPEIAQCFRKIAQSVVSDDGGSSVSRLAVFLNELFLFLLDMFRSCPVPLDRSLTTTQRTVKLFWQSLQENAEHLAWEWTVQRMAQQCKLGVTRFTHCTKELTNMAPGQYLNHCRLRVAERLLVSHPEMNVTQVAMACGFASGQYFATLFRRGCGMSPSRYRSERTQ